jgi:hypothetical protein
MVQCAISRDFAMLCETMPTAKPMPSTKPIAEKLQAKNGRALALIQPPPGLDGAIGGARAPVAKADVALLFARNRKSLEAGLAPLLKSLKPEAILWVAYPKLTSTLAGDLSRDVIHAWAPSHGLDTVSQIAIDNDWSALRLKKI